jgi:hypothetical protein
MADAFFSIRGQSPAVIDLAYAPGTRLEHIRRDGENLQGPRVMTWFAIIALGCAFWWLFTRRNEATGTIERLEARLNLLEFKIERLAEKPNVTPEPEPQPSPVAESVAAPPEPRPRATPPPIPPILTQQPQPQPEPVPVEPSTPPIPPLLPPHLPRPRIETPAIDFEKFLGVKLFAWVGGLFLFLAVAFFIKHAFDKNLITPAMRVTFGYITGLGLIIGGLFMPRERHAVTVQTLCATGLLVLYATIFASHAYFHFIGTTFAFALMAVVTGAAFYLAIHLNAQVVAVLGLLGGFLTPPLLSTGVDRAVGLFGYLALLDIGLLAVALRQRWNYLTLLAALATVAMQFGWVNEFFIPAKNPIALTIFLGFALLFVTAFAIANPYQRVEPFISAAVIVVLGAALVFPLYILWHPHRELAQNVTLLFTFVFLIDAGFLVLACLRSELRMAQLASGAAVFFLLSAWTAQYLTAATLNTALGLYLLFAVLHSVFPIVLQRFRPAAAMPVWSHVFPSLALLLVLLPIIKDTELSWMVWPVVLGIDLVAIVLAILTLSLTSILAVFMLTALVTAGWIMQTPAALPNLPEMLVVIGGFAIFFMAASVLASRRVFAQRGETGGVSQATFSQVASVSAMLPFLLLTLVVLRMPLANPTLVFSVAAVLAVTMLFLVRLFGSDWFAPVALGSVLLVEHVWHAVRFSVELSNIALAWYLGFGLLFLVFPLLFQRRLEQRVVPWAAAALSLPLHFFLIYRTVLQANPELAYKGLIPAALAIPCLAAFTRLLLTVPKESPTRNALLALFGGASLFFITFIFPVQYERHWLTIGWALEGLALVWLFRRVPHPGLRLVGVALLVTSFVRLALNPWVIIAYERTGTPIWNWYLYTYGLVTIALLTAARLLAPPRHRMLDTSVPPLLYSLGVVLAFLLVNVEIADSFSGPGNRLTFNFSGSFTQDMAYSLAWGVFAFALLAIGFKVKNAPTRYAGMGLLVLTIFKLFLHDVWRLGGMHRIGSLIGLAIVLIAVSFIYQRFLSSPTTPKEAAVP